MPKILEILHILKKLAAIPLWKTIGNAELYLLSAEEYKVWVGKVSQRRFVFIIKCENTYWCHFMIPYFGFIVSKASDNWNLNVLEVIAIAMFECMILRLMSRAPFFHIYRWQIVPLANSMAGSSKMFILVLQFLHKQKCNKETIVSPCIKAKLTAPVIAQVLLQPIFGHFNKKE